MRTTVKLLSISVTLMMSSAWSQSGGPYEITKGTIDGGGGLSSGGAYSVTGTIAQSDASLQSASGGLYSVTGGFWSNADIPAPDDYLFSDSFE